MNALFPLFDVEAVARLLLAALLTLMLPAAAGALPPGKAINQYRLDTWTSDDGLPQNAVEAILRSRRGFLWLATQGGLARYDGVTFRVYDHSNTPAISNNAFHCLTQDAAGVVWAGGEQGLLKIDGNELSAFGPADAMTDERVNAVLADDQGTLWVGTIRGLYRYADGRVTFCEELGQETILNLAQDPDGSLWIGTRNGLARLREGRLTTWSADDGLADGIVWALLAGRDGNVWVGTAVGLYRVRDAQLTRSGPDDLLPRTRIRALAEDRHGNLWIGTYGNPPRRSGPPEARPRPGSASST